MILKKSIFDNASSWHNQHDWNLHEYSIPREQANQQLQALNSFLAEERTNKQILEEELSNIEKEKAMLEVELKSCINQHRVEVMKKDGVICTVSGYKKKMGAESIVSARFWLVGIRNICFI